MTDIVLGDLITWPESGLRAPGNTLSPEAAGRPISWAVGIRPTSPALPALRGNEVVIISLSVLTELESVGGETLRQLFSLLAEQPVAGLIMDHPPPIPPPHLPLLLADVPFPADVESNLNRLLTERRAALYNLGSSLARGLSSAGLAGATLEDVLEEASRLSGYALALVTSRGSTIGRSSRAPAFVPAPVYEMPLGSSQRFMAIATSGGEQWMVAPVESHALPEGVRLAACLDAQRGTELARLTVNQTSDALRVLFDRARPLALDRRDERERTLRAFLTAKLSVEDSRVSAVFSGFGPEDGMRLALLTGSDHLEGDDNVLQAELDSETRAVIYPAFAEPSWLTGSRAAIVSRVVPHIAEIPVLLPDLQSMQRLVRCGMIRHSPIFMDRATDVGIAGLLVQLLGESPQAQRLAGWFSADLLGTLTAHDRERDAQLVRSLRAYLDAGRALGTAAERLGVHRNTLAYRLNQVRELTARDIDDPSVSLEYHIALIIHDLIQE